MLVVCVFFGNPMLKGFRCKTRIAFIRRAIAYAISKGVTVIGSSGNDNRDLDHPTFDDSSPDDGVPIMRNVTLECPQVHISLDAADSPDSKRL